MLCDAATQFASHGITALIYQRRGTSGSIDDSIQANFDGLAENAITGVKLLHAMPDIDPGCVGV